MRLTKKKILSALVVILLLASAYFLQNSPKPGAAPAPSQTEAAIKSADTAQISNSPGAQAPSPYVSKTPENEAAPSPSAPSKAAPSPKASQTPSAAPTSDPDAPTCSLSISCSEILDNMDKLAEGKASLIPADGVLLSLTDVKFTKGETVFDVLQRELTNRKMHFEFSFSPLYNTAYIEGICNIYEFDCGELSGWLYSVNGVFPNLGCSQYKLSDGDAIEFMYTCELGGSGKGG